RAVQRRIRFIPVFNLTTRGNNLLTFRNKDANDIHCLVKQSTRIVAKVEDKLLRTFLLQLGNGRSNFFPRTGCKVGEFQVTNVRRHHSVILQVTDIDLLPDYGKLEIVFSADATNFNLDGSPRLTLKQGADIGGRFTPDTLSIDGDDLVTDFQASFMSRVAFVWICDYDFVIHNSDQRTDASVLSGRADPKRFDFVFRNKIGVGIQRCQHAVDSFTDELLRIYFINIVGIYFLEERGENIQASGNVEVLFSRFAQGHAGGQHHHQHHHPFNFSLHTSWKRHFTGILAHRQFINLNIACDAQTGHSFYGPVPSAVRFAFKTLSILPNASAIFCEISANESNFDPVYTNPSSNGPSGSLCF